MRWRWGVGAGVIVLALLFLLSRTEKKEQPKLHEIRWEAPKEIVRVFKCDLDGDGNEEVVTALKDGEHWWLRPSLKGWRAIKMPVKWDVSLLPFPQLHLGMLACDENKSLCLLYYRNGWQFHKILDAPIDGHIEADVDGDGKVNDVLVLKSANLHWFQIDDNGNVVLKDKRKVPPGFSLFSPNFWSERGKLVIKPGWLRIQHPDLDWDGDGISRNLLSS